jgi:hypothetical protein
MPSLGDGNGSFIPERGDNRPHIYKVLNWVKEREWPRRRKRIGTGDLPKVDFMLVEVYPDDEPDNISYNTVWGPMDNWDFVESYLAYDYGEDGSLFLYDHTQGDSSTR